MNKQEFNLSEYEETIRVVLDSGGEFRIYPKGTSMLPLIRAGKDSVCIRKAEGNLRRNDIAFYLRDNGEYILHRVIKADNGRYTMCGDNQVMPETGIENKHIIGYVTRVYRGEKEITPKNTGYRLYLFLWRSFLIRRVFFKLRYIFGKDRKSNGGKGQR